MSFPPNLRVVLAAVAVVAVAALTPSAQAQPYDLIVSGPDGEMPRVLREAVLGPFQQRTGLRVLYRPNLPYRQADLWIAEAEAVGRICAQKDLLQLSWPILDRVQNGGLQLVDGARSGCGAGLVLDAYALAYRTEPAPEPKLPELDVLNQVPVDLPEEIVPEDTPEDSEMADTADERSPPTGWDDFLDPDAAWTRVATQDLRSASEAVGKDNPGTLTALAAGNTVETDQQVLARLEDGRASMAIARVSMIGSARQDRLAPLAVVPDTATSHLYMMSIPQSAFQRKPNAMRLIAFALQPEMQANIARISWFGLANTLAEDELGPQERERRATLVKDWSTLPRRDVSYWMQHPSASTGWKLPRPAVQPE